QFAVNVMGISPSGRTVTEVIDEGIAAFKRFIGESGMPTRLSEKGVTESDLPEIVKGVKKVSFCADGVLNCQPPVTEAMLLEILTKAL
ncbi:MAG: hypothetical protein IKW80_12020, partial [Thermoguttaceae bacterium]|nr:hypothetical protein [Thermoguttaceae bacterium]